VGWKVAFETDLYSFVVRIIFFGRTRGMGLKSRRNSREHSHKNDQWKTTRKNMNRSLSKQKNTNRFRWNKAMRAEHGGTRTGVSIGGAVPEGVRVGGEVAGGVPGGPPGDRLLGGVDAAHSLGTERRSEVSGEDWVGFGSGTNLLVYSLDSTGRMERKDWRRAI
jgi:hypothetical protein